MIGRVADWPAIILNLSDSRPQIESLSDCTRSRMYLAEYSHIFCAVEVCITVLMMSRAITYNPQTLSSVRENVLKCARLAEVCIVRMHGILLLRTFRNYMPRLRRTMRYNVQTMIERAPATLRLMTNMRSMP